MIIHSVFQRICEQAITAALSTDGAAAYPRKICEQNVRGGEALGYAGRLHVNDQSLVMDNAALAFSGILEAEFPQDLPTGPQ